MPRELTALETDVPDRVIQTSEAQARVERETKGVGGAFKQPDANGHASFG